MIINITCYIIMTYVSLISKIYLDAHPLDSIFNALVAINRRIILNRRKTVKQQEPPTKSNKPKIRAIAYYRGKSRESIAKQRACTRKYAKENNIKIIKEFTNYVKQR
jgi:hypothetical protein